MSSWEEKAKTKRESVLAKIPDEWILSDIENSPLNSKEYMDSILPESETKITSQTLLQLRDKILDRSLTSLEITKAFCHRAALAHQLINCCAEIFFERAYERAKELDDILEKTGRPVGPLHGLPISLKDQINLEGLDSAIGYVAKIGQPKTKDEESVIAEILYDAGSVFYIKTAVPMAMMLFDTYSHIYGQTLNAFNKKMSPGGSSGGESSLIGAEAGLIGLSTDIGGSIRCPAAFQGLFGIRPTTGRLPYAKMENSMAFQTVIPSVVGPSARNIDDLEYFVKVIIDGQPWLKDPKTPKMPWTPYEVPKKLAFGVLKNSGYITPHPPVQRAIDEAVAGLKAQGHEVIEWEPPVNFEEMTNNLNIVLTADGLKEIFGVCAESGEPPIPNLVGLNSGAVEVTATETWKHNEIKFKNQLKYDAYWQSTKEKTTTGRPVDGWLVPSWESASYPAGEVKPYHYSYTCPINYLDYTSVIVPITYADKNIDKPLDYEPFNQADKETKELYDPELFDKMPVTIQVITPRYEEERGIQLAKVIYNATH